MTDMASNFAAFIAAERERLNNERAAFWDQQKEIEDKLAAVEKELEAIKAYEAVKTGKPAAPSAALQEAKRPRTPRDPDAPKRTRAPRGEGTSIRQKVLDMIRSRDGGCTAGDLYAFLEMDDKAGRQAVNNALMALKKGNAIQQAGRRQPYTATEHPEQDDQQDAT